MRVRVQKKGQILLPKLFRDHLNVEPGDYVKIEKEDNFVKILPTQKSVLELAGSIKHEKGDPQKAIQSAMELEAKEVANEGKDN